MVSKAEGQRMAATAKADLAAKRAQRVVATLPPNVNQQLRALADDRFLGNVSAALTFCVGLAVGVLSDPTMAERQVRAPADALLAFRSGK